MANQSIQQVSCMICEISHAMKNTFVAFYVNRNCSLRIRIRRRNDPINISTWLLSRIMNSARLCIREMRGFERFHIGGSSEVYIIPRDTLFADTSSWGNASFLRSSESQEFEVVILLSWVPKFLFSWRDVRIKVTRYCRRRLTSAFHPVAGTLSRILRV